MQNEKKCYESNKDAMDKFVKCMDQLTTKTESLEKKFAYEISGMNIET